MNHLDLARLKLHAGAHSPNDEGEMCVMEAVAYFAHEPWSDKPKCASKVLTGFCIAWNDAMNDKDRQILKPFIPRLVGTVAAEDVERQRAYMALDWLCRVSTPTWLRLAGLKQEAADLEACAPIVDAESAKQAQAALDRGRAAAVGAAAGAAAWDAAWDAAGDAAGDAARAAARDAAWAATWAAASKKLRPTVRKLQRSALQLLDEMIEVGA